MGGEVSLHCSHLLLVIQLSVTQLYHGQRKTCKNLGRIELRRQNAVIIPFNKLRILQARQPHRRQDFKNLFH